MCVAYGKEYSIINILVSYIAIPENFDSLVVKMEVNAVVDFVEDCVSIICGLFNTLL